MHGCVFVREEVIVCGYHIASNLIIFFSLLQVKLLGLLPSLASHSAMIPLVVQILLPMLNDDVNPYVSSNHSYG